MDIYYRSLQGYDIVSASSNRRERVSSKLFYKVFEKYTDLSYEMTTESFRVLSRRVINRISSMNKTIPYRKAVYANCGLMTDNIKYNKINSIQETLDKREKKFRSVLMMFMSMIMIIYSVVIYATSNPVAGWTTTVLFLSIAFFGLFGILTIIIKYLQLCIDLVFKKKHYSFENIEKLTK